MQNRNSNDDRCKIDGCEYGRIPHKHVMNSHGGTYIKYIIEKPKEFVVKEYKHKEM